MFNNSCNESICCTVRQCKHHAKDANYCTLSQIEVRKNGAFTNSTECTDCASFEKDTNY